MNLQKSKRAGEVIVNSLAVMTDFERKCIKYSDMLMICSKKKIPLNYPVVLKICFQINLVDFLFQT